jgi:hypothetical protein
MTISCFNLLKKQGVYGGKFVNSLMFLLIPVFVRFEVHVVAGYTSEWGVWIRPNEYAIPPSPSEYQSVLILLVLF